MKPVDIVCQSYMSYLINSSMAEALYNEQLDNKGVRKLKIRAMEAYTEASNAPQFEEAKTIVDDLVSSNPLDFSEWAREFSMDAEPSKGIS